MSKQVAKTLVNLSTAFGMYAIRYPSILNRIPRSARIIITTKSYPQVYKNSIEMARRIMRKERRQYYLVMKTRIGWRLEKVENKKND